MARRHFSQDFIDRLVQEILQGTQTLTQIAQKWDIHPGVLSKWVKVYKEIFLPQNMEKTDIQLMQENIQILKDRT